MDKHINRNIVIKVLQNIQVQMLISNTPLKTD